MKISLATNEDDLRRLSGVLRQLRPQYTEDALIEQIQKQQQYGYQVAFLEMDNGIACVAGFVITEKLHWRKALYVDDLVTDERQRSKGAGNAMINWLKNFARENGCRELHLDSGNQRKDAHRFYDREGFDQCSLHFSIPLTDQ